MTESHSAPIVQVLFYYSDDYDDKDIGAMRSTIDLLQRKRAWVIGPPQFVDQIDDVDSGNPVDQPIRTVGCMWEMHSAFSPHEQLLSPEVDRQHLEEFRLVLSEMSKLSERNGREIGIAYDGQDIGWIEDGVPGRTIREGMLREWESRCR